MYFDAIIDEQGAVRLARAVARAVGGDLKRRFDDAQLLVRDAEHVLRRPRLAEVPGRHAGPAAARSTSSCKEWIPKITASPAYKANGLIVIMFDESGSDENAGACCGEVDGLGYGDPSHPNINEPGLYGPGGGKIGAVVLSKFIKPGTVSTKPYNHYSQLRASRTSSASRTSATPSSRRCSRSARTSTRSPQG